MALMKAALAWERFVLKDVTRFGCTCQGGTGALRQRGWHVEGCGQPHQGCSHLQVGSGQHEGCCCEHCCCHRDCLLVLHRRVHRQGQLGWLSSLGVREQMWCSRVFTCKNKENSVLKKK